jgi:hypothetical protein
VLWGRGTRHARAATVRVGERTFAFEPQHTFFMLGLGYGHPRWSHGLNHGPLAVEREDFDLATMDVRQPHHLHIQALSKVTTQGRGANRSAAACWSSWCSAPTRRAASEQRWIGRSEPMLADRLAAYLSELWSAPPRSRTSPVSLAAPVGRRIDSTPSQAVVASR